MHLGVETGISGWRVVPHYLRGGLTEPLTPAELRVERIITIAPVRGAAFDGERKVWLVVISAMIQYLHAPFVGLSD
jgi:hypothetical protein